jgi:alpha-L-fucosidase
LANACIDPAQTGRASQQAKRVAARQRAEQANGHGDIALTDLQRAFVDWRFGMFLHFGILTYTGRWAEAHLDIEQFNPTQLNPGQWADAALSAKMTFGVLTTKHHDGFALWDTKDSSFDVASTPWKNGKGDVVREYVEAFRAKGLGPGLYYSVWDATAGIGNRPIGRSDIDYVKAQLTELLTNYGPIPLLVFDGWSWKMGHRAMPFAEIHDHVKSLQPSCLMVDHTHLRNLWDNDLAMFEEPKGVFSPVENTIPAGQDNKIVSGNDWFWAPSSGTQDPLSLDSIVSGHLRPLEASYTTFILNCPPNRQGLLGENITRRLAEVGRSWFPNLARAPLPPGPPQNEFPITALRANASSGEAMLAIDGINDAGHYTTWQSSPQLPQSITLDLGETYPDVGILYYVPKYESSSGPTDEGAITSYAIQVSAEGGKFARVAKGQWAADSTLKVATFAPTRARYVRLEAITAQGGYAAATEISVGARPQRPR